MNITVKIISKHCINKQTAQWFSQITATFYSCFFFVNVERRVIQSKHWPSPPQTFIHSSQRINFSNYWQYVSVADSGFLWCGGRINEKGRGATIGRKSWCIYSEQMAPQPFFLGHFITFWLPLDAPKWSDHTPESTSAVYWLSTL